MSYALIMDNDGRSRRFATLEDAKQAGIAMGGWFRVHRLPGSDTTPQLAYRHPPPDA